MNMKALLLLVLLPAMDTVRLCGSRLADLLNYVCEAKGGFQEPQKRAAATRQGVVDECCKRPCSLSTLNSYCAAGNVEEGMPPDVPQESQMAKTHRTSLPGRPRVGGFTRAMPFFVAITTVTLEEEETYLI